MKEQGGEIVKWLGDGTMTVFEEPAQAIEALLSARDRVQAIEAEGYEPRLRAGVHVGRPRQLGGDYLGVDVNVAARVAEEAGAGELLVSGHVLELVDADVFEIRKHFGVKGVPKDVTAYAVSRS